MAEHELPPEVLRARAKYAALSAKEKERLTRRAHLGVVSARQFVDRPSAEPEYDWLIPNLLERRDRFVLTGYEGHGKSTFNRQFGVQCHVGMHPFTLESMDARWVTLFDFENTDDQIRRKLRPLLESVGDALDGNDGRLEIVTRSQGIDLLKDGDRAWFGDVLEETQPELLLVGPLYKTTSEDLADEYVASDLTAVFDEIREEYLCALVLEAHCPQAGQNGRRVKRAYGASLLLRWPEFGVHLGEHGELSHWRTPRDERDWPAALRRGGEWPWIVDHTKRPSDAGASSDDFEPTVLMERVSRALEAADDGLSKRDVLRDVKGRNEYIGLALDRLAEAGHITRDTSGRAHIYRNVTPYRQPSDDEST
jgi:hypothetical protein